jgi:hypothetical protein
MVNNITSHNNMNHSSVKHQTLMVKNIASHNNTNHFSVKPQTLLVKNITSHNNMNHSSLWLVILLTIIVWGLTEEWFILLWLLYC